MSDKSPSERFLTSEILKVERRWFAFRLIATVGGYIALTLILNAIRTTIPVWLLWPMIIVQFGLYFYIFGLSEARASQCGLKRIVGVILFTVLAILGRVNDWELLIIPAVVATMLFVSARTKKLSAEGQAILPNKV